MSILIYINATTMRKISASSWISHGLSVGDPGITQESLYCNYNDEEQVSGSWGLRWGCDYKEIE